MSDPWHKHDTGVIENLRHDLAATKSRLKAMSDAYDQLRICHDEDVLPKYDALTAEVRALRAEVEGLKGYRDKAAKLGYKMQDQRDAARAWAKRWKAAAKWLRGMANGHHANWSLTLRDMDDLEAKHAELVRLVREWLDADDLQNITVDPDGKVSHWGRGWTPEREALVKAVDHVSTRHVKMVPAAVRGDTEGANGEG